MELAALRETVDEFFESVMVMAEDEEVRVNRLTLLSKLRELVPAGGGYLRAAVSLRGEERRRLRAPFYAFCPRRSVNRVSNPHQLFYSYRRRESEKGRKLMKRHVYHGSYFTWR